MDELTIKISLSKLIELAMAEQRLEIKKYLIATLGPSVGDVFDKYQPTAGTILDTIKTLSE